MCEALYYVKSTRTWPKKGRVSYETLIFSKSYPLEQPLERITNNNEMPYKIKCI